MKALASAALVATALALTGLATTPGSAAATDADIKRIERDLKLYGVRADATKLTDAQILRIRSIIHSPRTHSDKRLLIKSTVGGRNSLFETLFGD